MKRILFPLLIVTSLLLGACSQPQSSATAVPVAVVPVPTEYAGLTNPLGAESAEAGRKLFNTNCVTCHGDSGLGDGPVGMSLSPRPANLKALNQIATDDYFYWRINTGKPGTAMVGWKGILTDEQIWQVISFIRTLK